MGKQGERIVKILAIVGVFAICLGVAFAAGLVLAFATASKAQEQDFY